MKKLKPIEGKGMGCLHAGSAPQLLPLHTQLAVGFGDVVLTCDGNLIWSGDEAFKKRPKTVLWCERRARKKPNADWRIAFNAPLSDRIYQRQGQNEWLLVKQGLGFA